MAQTLELVFRTSQGRDSVIALADPKEGLTRAAAVAVMEEIIAKNLFLAKDGALIAAADARIRSRDVAPLA